MRGTLRDIFDEAADLQGYELINTVYHDTRSVCPLHITVISALGDVLDLDPTENHLDLASCFSVVAIDDLVDENESELATISFRYDKFGSDLKVLLANNGTVLIYGPVDEGGRKSANCIPE